MTILEIGEYSEASGIFPIPAAFSSSGLAVRPDVDARSVFGSRQPTSANPVHSRYS